MTEPKPMAALTSGLLARKGAARPAMRSPLQPLQHYRDSLARAWPSEDEAHDLGWNDMGHDRLPDPESVVPLPVAEPLSEPPAPEPLLAPEPLPAPVSVPVDAGPRVALPARARALAEGRRAAFTLRVDAERHLRLRLACAVTGRSAQNLLIEAMDRLIAEYPQIATLAAQAGVATHRAPSSQGSEQ